MDEVLELGWGIYAFAAASVFAGTMLQRLAGQGFGMIAAPLIALVAPQFLPATLLLIGAVVGFSATTVDRSAIATEELAPGFAGRALGAIIAAWIAASLTNFTLLALLVAGVVYLGIALSLLGARVAIQPGTLFTAGMVAGIMGTLTAVGAPPMALLYQHERARRSAAMQNAFFAWGMLVSIGALALVGLVGQRHLAFAASLLPFALLALWLVQPLAEHVEKARIRPYALGLASLAATVLLIRQLG